MNGMQKIISCMLLCCIESVFFAEPSSEKREALAQKRESQEQQFVREKQKEPVRTIVAPAAHEKIEPKKALKKAVELKKEPTQETHQLIDTFIHSVDQIQGSCDSKIRDQKGRKSDHHDRVEKAYRDYKNLYDHFHIHKYTINTQENDKIKAAVKKLFDCKNIKKMVWSGHVDEKNTKTS